MKVADINRNRRGFTLMEVIVTIMAAGILAAFFVHFMGTSLSSASDSVTRVQAESGGEATVERIIADYVLAMNSGSPAGELVTISDNIGSNIYDDAAANIQVVRNFIEFDAGGNEVDNGLNPTNTLKVTVQVEGNNQVFLLGQARTAGTQPSIFY
jgi:prepilin-type N-terminal cleavage/methylation domain-containing protein